MIKELHEFFEKCPLLSGGEMNVDYLGSESGSYTIEPVPCEPVLKKYHTGGERRQYTFRIALRQNYRGSPAENMQNEELCEKLADWVEECAEKGVLPELSDGKTAQEISVITGGYMNDESSGYARYQIGFRLVYTKISV